jgi:hypothetical protein
LEWKPRGLDCFQWHLSESEEGFASDPKLTVVSHALLIEPLLKAGRILQNIAKRREDILEIRFTTLALRKVSIRSCEKHKRTTKCQLKGIVTKL